MTKHTIDVKNLQVTKKKECAAGVTTVVSAYKNVSTKVGPIKGTRLLTQLNQIQGFDCPGCAWPDTCLLYTSPSPRDLSTSRMPSSA